MWKAWVAAAVTGIGVFAAVVLVGRDLVEPQPVETALVPARSWAERAGQHCRDSMGAVRAELTSPRGLETQEAQALRLYRETTRIEGRLVARLRELPGAPADGAEAVELLAAQHQRDARTVAQLEQALDPALILREIAAYERVAERLQARFEALGAKGCVRYLDPASYG
jgi:hypothetical protein